MQWIVLSLLNTSGGTIIDMLHANKTYMRTTDYKNMFCQTWIWARRMCWVRPRYDQEPSVIWCISGTSHFGSMPSASCHTNTNPFISRLSHLLTLAVLGMAGWAEWISELGNRNWSTWLMVYYRGYVVQFSVSPCHLTAAPQPLAIPQIPWQSNQFWWCDPL